MEDVVLLAHPDQEWLEELAEKLDEVGIRCLTARTGFDALSTASNYGPKVAVLQAELPEVQGTDVCLRLKQELKHDIRVVILTDDASVEQRFVSSEVGADAYVVEPYDDEELLTKVQQQLATPVENGSGAEGDNKTVASEPGNADS